MATMNPIANATKDMQTYTTNGMLRTDGMNSMTLINYGNKDVRVNNSLIIPPCPRNTGGDLIGIIMVPFTQYDYRVIDDTTYRIQFDAAETNPQLFVSVETMYPVCPDPCPPKK